VRVLLVEDDRQIGDGLAAGLRALGFAVDWFEDGSPADSSLDTVSYDAIVLDLGLPGDDGLVWLARWRSRGARVPVLVLTARDALDSRIEGLDAGADDYLLKPIAVTELAARLRAVARRSQGRAEPVWTHGALVYNPADKSALWEGRAVVLTSREAALLEALLANPGRILSKSAILEKLYGWNEELESNAIEVYVHHLRRKFDASLVRTVRGVGYALGKASVPASPALPPGESS
jgi:two-component system, OmpR family, response regulator QseB